MVELGIRILIAGAILFIAGVLGGLGFDFAWKAALAIAALGFFGWQLENKSMKNPGVAGFLAVADAFIVALTLGSAGQIGNFGFLVLVPCAVAATRHGSQPNFMAPLAGSSLLVAYSTLHQGQVPSALLLAQAAGVLAVGMLLSHTKLVAVPAQIDEAALAENEIVLEKDEYFELRENFRKLRDAYRDLEHKSRKGRMLSQLDEIRTGTDARFFARLANKLKEISGADHAAIYTVAQFAEQFVVRATTAGSPQELEDASFKIDLDLAPGQIKHRVEQALLAIKTDADRAKVANILLMESGRVSGMITLSHTESAKLAEAQAKADEIAPYLASLIQEEMRREAERRRLRETELLYEVATVTAGSTNATTLASRVVRELFENLRADHVGIYMLEGEEAILLANQGIRVRVLESMQFSNGQGVRGWIDSDAPELIVFDAREDHRIDAQEALKKRVGSFSIFPLLSATGPIGFIAAACHSRGGLDTAEFESLRIASVELGQALRRLEAQATDPEGVMTPSEFARRVQGGDGCLVYLEPLRREQLAETFGKPALGLALRKFLSQIRRKLPNGGCICRRDEGDYIVFLPGATLDAATSWANDASASAAMIGVKTPDGSARIPLAFRSKSAYLNKQESEVLDQITA